MQPSSSPSSGFSHLTLSQLYKDAGIPEQPLVSVVTPVHNGERYLRRCIESVIAQSHVNWDYTIVNNCSTDGTLDMALEYASRDRRIRVHNNSSFLPINANYNMAFHQD